MPQGAESVRGGVESAQEMDFLATLAQQKFTETCKPTPRRRNCGLRRYGLNMEEARMRECKSGGS